MTNELHYTSRTVYRWEQRLYNFNLHNMNHLRIDVLKLLRDVDVTVQKRIGVTTELSAKH